MNSEYTNNESTQQEKREYHATWEQALSSWKKLDGKVAAISEVKEIIERLTDVNGHPTEAYIPSLTRPYVAVIFAGDSTRAGAWIHVGFVDHLVSLPGAEYFTEKKFYRTKLSTWSDAGIHTTKTKDENRQYCSKCGMQLPLVGKCTCT